MQSNLFKFMALAFIALVLCITSTYGQGILIDGVQSNTCTCLAPKRRLTRQCCDESQGFVQSEQCHARFIGKFLRCCRSLGFQGSCTTPDAQPMTGGGSSFGGSRFTGGSSFGGNSFNDNTGADSSNFQQQE